MKPTGLVPRSENPVPRKATPNGYYHSLVRDCNYLLLLLLLSWKTGQVLRPTPAVRDCRQTTYFDCPDEAVLKFEKDGTTLIKTKTSTRYPAVSFACNGFFLDCSRTWPQSYWVRLRNSNTPYRKPRLSASSMSNSADLLVYHQPTLYLQRSGDYQWQLPAPGRDRRWQDRDRPYTSTQQSTTNNHRPSTMSSRPASMSSTRQRSNTAMAHYSSNEPKLSPTSSVRTLSRPYLHDMRSVSENIVSRTERPESLTKTLVSKGYRLLRRQNSKSDLTSLRTMDWKEQSSTGNASRKPPRHSRWQSTDSGMLALGG